LLAGNGSSLGIGETFRKVGIVMNIAIIATGVILLLLKWDIWINSVIRRLESDYGYEDPIVRCFFFAVFFT